MKIRTATIDDLAAISAIEATCFPATEAAKEQSFIKRLTVYPEHFWLLEVDNRLIGFINGLVANCKDLTDEMYENTGLHNAKGDWQMIFGLNTLPEYRCHGYAGKLIKHLITQARTQGRKGVVLTCKENLIHYYAKFGFINEGISASTHGDVIWYQMRLSF